MNLLAIIPMPYRLLALGVLAAALLSFGWVKGADHAQAKYDALLAKTAAKTVRIAAAQTAVTATVDAKYTPLLERVRTVTQTIIKEVPTYVSANDCPLSPGFRVLHDAAAAGELPDPARVADAAAVPAPAVAEAVVANYGACTETATRLTGLQEWVKRQRAVK